MRQFTWKVNHNTRGQEIRVLNSRWELRNSNSDHPPHRSKVNPAETYLNCNIVITLQNTLADFLLVQADHLKRIISLSNTQKLFKLILKITENPEFDKRFEIQICKNVSNILFPPLKKSFFEWKKRINFAYISFIRFKCSVFPRIRSVKTSSWKHKKHIHETTYPLDSASISSKRLNYAVQTILRRTTLAVLWSFERLCGQTSHNVSSHLVQTHDSKQTKTLK